MNGYLYDDDVDAEKIAPIFFPAWIEEIVK